MNIKVLDGYRSVCKDLGIEGNFDGLKLYYYIYNLKRAGEERL